jgi:serine/threonine-protein kinase HSL1, negative regulator of Swe1 kinase
LTEHEACHIMKGILEGINYCHKNMICHRDLKPENILINENDEIKIIDFGLADIFKSDEKSLSGRKGSEHYMAPEVLKRGTTYNEKCDIWCIGHMFFLLISLCNPFKNSEDKEQGIYRREKVKDRSDKAIDLLDKMLNPNPDERITA